MTTTPFIYYYDEALTKRVPVNEVGEPIINWGVLVPGQRKELELYLQNNTKDRFVIRQPQTNDEDLRIIDFPVNLMGNDSGKVKLEFHPHADRLDPHNGTWGFDVIIG